MPRGGLAPPETPPTPPPTPSSPPALAVPREPGKPYGPLTATRKLTARVLQNLFQ